MFNGSQGRFHPVGLECSAMHISTPPADDCDVLIVGGAPAGASAAAVCAGAGLRVRVVERAFFPRPKVCGDCLNPDVWPVLERIGAAEMVRWLPHVDLQAVEFVGWRGARVRLPLPAGRERTVKRSDLDAALLAHAARKGAAVTHGQALTEVRSAGSETVGGVSATLTDGQQIHARFLIAADGRNSVVVRTLGLPVARPTFPSSRHARIGFQTHVPRGGCPPEFTAGGLVQMRWFPGGGYGGLAPTGDGELNVSLGITPDRIPAMRAWAEAEFGLATDWPGWQTIAPLDRPALRVPVGLGGRVFVAGDAARVVEPFTGEGIYYALRSGELAGECVVRAASGEWTPARAAREYTRAHRRVYRERGRLWVNRLARAAALHPVISDAALALAGWQPGILRWLTAKVVPAPRAAVPLHP